MNKSIYELLSENFIKTKNINDDTEYTIEEIDACKLLCPERIDLSAKLIYIRAVDKGLDLDFAKEIYSKHIEAFSDGYFSEPGDENKTTLDSFFKEFDSIINSIKENGFDENISLIPVNKDYVILDGAHRTACAIYFNKKVKVIKFNDFSVDFGYKYFREKMLSDELLRYMSIEYARYSNQNLYCSCIWPSSSQNKRTQAISLIESKGKIVYETDVMLDYNGLRNLMIQIYGHQEWIGNIEDHFKGVMGKVDPCYVPGVPTKVVLFVGGELGEILDLKEKIRAIFNIGKHALHISDSIEETKLMLDLLYNDNSLQSLNFSTIYKDADFFNAVKEFSDRNKSEYLLSYKETMSFFGIKHFGDNSIEFTDSITFNPRNYFVFNGVKIPSIDKINIEEFKLTAEERDKYEMLIHDIECRDEIRKREYKNIKRQWKKQQNILKAKQFAAKIAGKLGIYEFLHKLHR